MAQCEMGTEAGGPGVCDPGLTAARDSSLLAGMQQWHMHAHAHACRTDICTQAHTGTQAHRHTYTFQKRHRDRFQMLKSFRLPRVPRRAKRAPGSRAWNQRIASLAFPESTGGIRHRSLSLLAAHQQGEGLSPSGVKVGAETVSRALEVWIGGMCSCLASAGDCQRSFWDVTRLDKLWR